MKVTVVDHPLVAASLTELRDAATSSRDVRRAAETLVTLLGYEATRGLAVDAVTVRTPLDDAPGVQLRDPPPLVVPVMRAGLGMLDGLLRLLPAVEVGFAGLVRDEATAEASWYADRMPADLTGRQVLVCDPMLATGGTLLAVVRELLARHAASVVCVCLLAAPEGVAALGEALPDERVSLVVAAVDDRLDDRAYIVPGLGDAGDRLYGTAADTG